MSDFILLRRFLAYRRIQNALAAAVTAMSVALAVTVLLLVQGLHGGVVRAAEPFPMLMGAKGSPNQLVLNGVFLQDEPMGNIDYREVAKLREDPNAAMVVPLGFGDSYRGFRIVGTENEIFDMRGISAKSAWLRIAEGRAFAGPHEAVIGAQVAESSGLKIGDKFSSIHGTAHSVNSSVHDGQFTVVGILSPLRGPYDASVLVSMESLWLAHSHGVHGGEREVTAAVIRPAGYAQAMQLAAQYAKDAGVQIVFPSKIVVRLFYIMGNVEQIMRLFSWGVITLALIIIACSMYWFVIGSAREQSVMRALGATKDDVSAINFEIGLTLVTCGTALGAALGHAAFACLGTALQNRTAVYISAGFMPEEAVLLAAVLTCGALCSWLPARLSAGRGASDSL